MGLFNIFKKVNKGYFYIVDEKTLYDYINKDIQFTLESNLDACSNFNIYLNEKHHIQIWNENRLKFYYDEKEYSSLDELKSLIGNLPNYFKIELIDTDDKFLNDYKKEHPELKVEDY